MTNETDIKPTHGFSCDDTDPEGVHRKIAIHKFEDGGYSVTMVTKWPDDDEPLLTNFMLGKQALDLLAFVACEAVTKMDSYPVGDESSE